MNPKHRILSSNVNTYLGAILMLSFGLLVITFGLKAYHIADSIAEALSVETQLP